MLKNIDLPLKTGKYSHVVVYDQTAENLKRFFALNRIEKCADFFQTPLEDESKKYGSKIELYCKQTSV